MHDNEMPTDDEIRVMTENYVNALVEYKRIKNKIKSEYDRRTEKESRAVHQTA